jgi:uncharacterized protein
VRLVSDSNAFPSGEGFSTVAWSKSEPFGAEFANVRLGRDRLSAEGVAIGSAPVAYRLDYTLVTAADFVATKVEVSTRGDGWQRSLTLTHSPSGGWTATTQSVGDPPLAPPGGEVGQFAEALDPDLGLSPLFNTMPVLRHRIHQGGLADDLTMLWISVPDLGLHRSAQRYTFVDRLPEGALVRLEAIGDDFVADIVFDERGLVMNYPGIARRIPTPAMAKEG